MRPQYCITHRLAFNVWRAKRYLSGQFALPATATEGYFSPCLPKSQDWERLGNWLGAIGVRPPYSFLVMDPSQRHLTDCRFQARRISNLLVEGSVFRLVDGQVGGFPFDLYIVSPELNYIQMANGLSLIETIGYGYELCGTYTRLESGKERPRRLPALTDTAKLEAYLQRARGMHGIKQARRAVKHVLSLSGSVKETESAMMLTLPRRMNGFEAVKPMLNYPIEVDRTGKPFVSQDRFVVDMFWPQYRVGLEIDTNMHHSDPAKHVKDARRRNALKHYGYTIIEGTQGDTGNALGMAGLAAQLYQLMGLAPKPGQFEIQLGTLALFDEIARLSQFP